MYQWANHPRILVGGEDILALHRPQSVGHPTLPILTLFSLSSVDCSSLVLEPHTLAPHSSGFLSASCLSTCFHSYVRVHIQELHLPSLQSLLNHKRGQLRMSLTIQCWRWGLGGDIYDVLHSWQKLRLYDSVLLDYVGMVLLPNVHSCAPFQFNRPPGEWQKECISHDRVLFFPN